MKKFWGKEMSLIGVLVNNKRTICNVPEQEVCINGLQWLNTKVGSFNTATK